jgi:hypothetical protein
LRGLFVARGNPETDMPLPWLCRFIIKKAAYLYIKAYGFFIFVVLSANKYKQNAVIFFPQRATTKPTCWVGRPYGAAIN